nr:RNA-dependent RNA polymerase [Flumine narna-like virus 43]
MDINDKNNGFDDPILRKLFIQALTEHEYIVKTERKKVAGQPQPDIQQFTEPQKVGQLMGSIVSFIVLCIINGACMRCAFEAAHQIIVHMRNFGGWINGDDCLTPYSDQRFPAIWEAIAQQFGFAKSLGKTYASCTFCTMNSTLFEVATTDNDVHTWSMVPYVNLGLVHGMKRSTDAATERLHYTELGTLHQELMSTCPPDLKIPLTTLFLEVHKEALAKAGPLPWFLPEWMGGLGLVQNYEYTAEDRHWARSAMDVQSDTPFRCSTPKEWFMYDIFNQFVKTQGHGLVTNYPYREYEGSDRRSIVYAQAVYYLWAAGGTDMLHIETYKSPRRKAEALLDHYRTIQRHSVELRRSRGQLWVDDYVFHHEQKVTVSPVTSLLMRR